MGWFKTTEAESAIKGLTGETAFTLFPRQENETSVVVQSGKQVFTVRSLASGGLRQSDTSNAKPMNDDTSGDIYAGL